MIVDTELLKNGAIERTYAYVPVNTRVQMLVDVEHGTDEQPPRVVPWLRYAYTGELIHPKLPIEALQAPHSWVAENLARRALIPYSHLLSHGEYRRAVIDSPDGEVRQYRWREGGRMNVLHPPHFGKDDVFCRGATVPRNPADFDKLQHLPFVEIVDESAVFRASGARHNDVILL